MTAHLWMADGDAGDPSATRINLLDIAQGYSVDGWRQPIAAYKGGGVFSQSALADFSQLVLTRYELIQDVFPLPVVTATTQDNFAKALQDLLRLLIKAKDYWVHNWQNQPVWIEARASCETNMRYAHVVLGELPDVDDVFSQQFTVDATMNDLQMNVKHLHWAHLRPALTECVEVSGMQEGWELNQISNAGFEILGASPPTFLHWSESIPPGAAVVADAGIFAGGVQSCRLDNGLGGAPDVRQSIAVTAGQMLDLTFYTRGNGVSAGFYAVWDNTNAAFVIPLTSTGQTAAAWAQITSSFIVPVGCVSIEVRFYGALAAGQSIWFDIISLPFATDFGRDVTCLDEVYWQNKHNEAQLTHIFVDNGGAFGPNLLLTSLPHTLLPLAPAINDAVYFGIETLGVLPTETHGPFNNLIFDLSQSTTGTGIWEYWNGVAWGALTISPSPNLLTATGVSSVNWYQPSDWAVTMVNGVQGFWIRFRKTNASAQSAIQQNRTVYTVNWNTVLTKQGDVVGDIAALARFILKNTAEGDPGEGVPGTWLDAHIDKVFIAARQKWRGVDFRSHLYVSQLPDGITFAGATVTDVTTPTGQKMQMTAAARLATWTLSGNSVIQQYCGRYRVFALVDITSGSPVLRIGQYASLESTAIEYDSEYTAPQGTSKYCAVDFGVITIPQWKWNEHVDTIDCLSIRIEMDAAIGGTLDLFGIYLLPIDEYAIECDNLLYSATNLPGSCEFDHPVIDIDGVQSRKHGIRSSVKNLDESLYLQWRNITNYSDAILKNQQQSIHILAAFRDALNSNEDMQYIPDIGGTIKLEKLQRYLSMRGDR